MATELTYSVICQSIMGNPTDGYSTVFGMNGERFHSRKEAIRHGFTMDRSDDFNIGVWRGEELISLDWMDTPIDTDPAVLRTIQDDGEIRA